jgi:hypothetical protein
VPWVGLAEAGFGRGRAVGKRLAADRQLPCGSSGEESSVRSVRSVPEFTRGVASATPGTDSLEPPIVGMRPSHRLLDLAIIVVLLALLIGLWMVMMR